MEKVPGADRAADAGQLLVNDAAGAEIQMSHF